MIVQRLHEIQDRLGYLPDAELAKVAREAAVPLYRVQEVAGFFPHFRQEWNKPPRVEIRVCRDMSCHLAGSPAQMLARIVNTLARKRLATSPSQASRALAVAIAAPACSISRQVHDDSNGRQSFLPRLHLRQADLGQELRRIAGRDHRRRRQGRAAGYRREVHAAWQSGRLANRPYIKHRSARFRRSNLSGRPGLPSRFSRAAIRGKDVRTSIPGLARLDPSGLLGMGGAGVPAYRKWLDVWQADGDEKYVVCNGDESEPGTFKDREILLRMPHLVVEGVILAGLMTNATAGYIYIRHEYGEQIAGGTSRRLSTRLECELAGQTSSARAGPS